MLAMSNYHRWYRPNDGRYLSPDPIGLAGGEAGYSAYAGGRPMVTSDPTGLIPPGDASCWKYEGKNGDGVDMWRNLCGGNIPTTIYVTESAGDDGIKLTPHGVIHTGKSAGGRGSGTGGAGGSPQSGASGGTGGGTEAPSSRVPPFNEYWLSLCRACCGTGMGSLTCKSNCQNRAENGGENGENLPTHDEGPECHKKQFPPPSSSREERDTRPLVCRGRNGCSSETD